MLGKFFEYIKMSPEEFIEFAKNDPEQAEKLLLDYREHLLKTRAKGSVLAYSAAVNSFLEYYKVPLRIRNKNLRATPEKLDYIPSLEEINLLLSYANIDYKAILGLIAFSGLRPSDVVNLRYKNIMEDIVYDSDKGLYVVKRLPAKIELKQDKTDQWYVTFMGPRCASLVTDYLNYLLRKRGSPLAPNDKLFKQTVGAVIAYWWNLLKRCNLKRDRGIRRLRLYSLRKYFRRAVSRLGEDIAEYLMGHLRGINSLSATYSGLRDLDDTAIEQLRQSFATIVEELEGSSVGTREVLRQVEDLRKQLEQYQQELYRLRKQNELLVKLVEEVFMGLPYEDWSKLIDYANELLYQRTQEELNETLNEAFLEALRLSKQLKKQPKPMPTYTNGGRKHIIVKTEQELLQYLDMGYELVHEFGDGRFLLRAP